MDKIKVMLLTLYFMILEKKASSLTVKTEDVVFDLQKDNRIILNCTYNKDDTEDISDRGIKWQKQIDGTFKDVAFFSPPGGQAPFIQKEMENLYKNRTELIGPNTSLSAVMIIKDPVCIDEGTYRCWIQYYALSSVQEEVNSSVVVFNARATKPKEFLVFPNEVEENQSITIHCIADVGSPQGYIQILKETDKSIVEEVIYNSTKTTGKTENCTDLINVTTTYNITRDDNGALFRCSSKNNFTKNPIPSSDLSKISVLYGPDKPTINLTPHKTIYSIGDPLTIQCITKSNPPPVFTWIFKPHNKSGDTRVEYSNDKSKKMFSSLKAEDSGIYICMVNNSARPHILNSSANINVSVVPKISEREYSGCNQCGYMETCQQSNEKTVCVYNFWMPIAVVCILLSAVFAVSSIVMVKQRKKTQKSTATNNISIENKSPPSDATPGEMHGGYISPEDLEFGCLPPSVTQEGKGVAYSRL